jgi:hypothetical protein
MFLYAYAVTLCRKGPTETNEETDFYMQSINIKTIQDWKFANKTF